MHAVFAFYLLFRWQVLPDWITKNRRFDTDPILSPTTIGCAFVVDKTFFFELGGFDEGMYIWGGENLEMSFRTWQCGGSIYIFPCSTIGHMFRQYLPYIFPFSLGGSGAVRTNYQRTVEVWMDDFREFYYASKKEFIPLKSKEELLSLQHRKALRKKLGCKSFRWYLDNVAKSIMIPQKEANYQGQIKAVINQECLTADTVSGYILFTKCERNNRDQYFFYSNNSLIHYNASHCVALRVGKDVPALEPCQPWNTNHLWDFSDEVPANSTQHLYFRDLQHPIGSLKSLANPNYPHCLTQVSVAGSGVQIPGYMRCQKTILFQYWVFTYHFDFQFSQSVMRNMTKVHATI